MIITLDLNPLSANTAKWSNTLKQFDGCWPTNCLGVFDHFVGLALKGLMKLIILTLSRRISQGRRFSNIEKQELECYH